MAKKTLILIILLITFLLVFSSPVITNITTNPLMPFYNTGLEQNISVNFSSNEYPVKYKFNLYYSNGSRADNYYKDYLGTERFDNKNITDDNPLNSTYFNWNAF